MKAVMVKQGVVIAVEAKEKHMKEVMEKIRPNVMFITKKEDAPMMREVKEMLMRKTTQCRMEQDALVVEEQDDIPILEPVFERLKIE